MATSRMTMMNALIWATALAAISVSSSVVADGNALLKACQALVTNVDSNGATGDPMNAGYCLGVITGVTSLTGVTNPAMPPEGRTCLPNPPASKVQAARITVKYMIANPEFLHLDDGVLVMLALHAAYPCGK
jgi:hypothetical protein